MADSQLDRELEELIHIKLGLEKRSETIFKDLLARNEYDPLDHLIKRMSDDNLKIESLKRELLSANDEIRQLKKGNKGVQEGNKQKEEFDLKSKEPRSSSLPINHKQDIESVEQKKIDADKMQTQYKSKIENYIIFLLKCIREISKAPQEKKENFEKTIEKLEKALNKEKERVLELTGENKKLMADKTNNSASLFNPQEKNAVELINSIKKEQNPEKTFEKINESLGLKELWTTYIEKLKSESKLYHQLIEITKNEAAKATIPLNITTNQPTFFNNNHNIKPTTLFNSTPFTPNSPFSFGLSGSTPNPFGGLSSQSPPGGSLFSPNSSFTESKSNNTMNSTMNTSEVSDKISWWDEIKKIETNAESKLRKENVEKIFESVFESKLKEIESVPEKASELIQETITYFLQKLDNLFVKHNQHPYQDSNKPDFFSFQENLKSSILSGDWVNSKTITNNEINRIFRHIERRTKFYSNNRFFLKPN